jgi:hypothetical protein
MRGILLVIALLVAALGARAERIDIDTFSASINVPDSEGWFRRGGPQLRTGEFVVYAVNSTTKGFFGVAAIPGYPTSDVRHATVLGRIMETMRGSGFEPTRQRFGTQGDQPYVEVIGGHTTDIGTPFIMVARGMLTKAHLFITLHAVPGHDADADKPEFMAYIETLTFNAPVAVANYDISTKIPQLIPWHYRAYRGAALAAALLVVSFFIMLFVTRERRRDR